MARAPFNPNIGQQAQMRGFRSRISDVDLHEDVSGIARRVFNEYVEIAIFVEHSRTEQLEFRLVLATMAMLFN